jgi:hypothetical protein
MDYKLTDEEAILQYTKEMYMASMPQESPLWEMHLFEEYKETQSILSFKFHHGFADGLSAFGLAC